MSPRRIRSRLSRLSLAACLITVPLSRSADFSRPTVGLSNSVAIVSVDLAGGSIHDFRLRGSHINPLGWDSAGNPDSVPPEQKSKPRARGHFLCLDRWGQATEAEYRNGMSYHGEASQVNWRHIPVSQTESKQTAELPIAGLGVERTVRLSADRPVFSVSERVINRNKLGRVYNMVQHPSINAPFLDSSTVVDCNGREGFMQSSPMPRPEIPTVVWPQAINRNGQSINLRHLESDPDPNVVSYVCDDEFGWVTATSRSAGLMIGYLWRTADYPWISLWRHSEGGKPAARGLEFGTTGLHQTFGVLVKKGQIFGRPLMAYLDAGESSTRSYLCFLVTIPSNHQGVARLERRGGSWIAVEREGSPVREIEVARELDFPNP